MLSKQGIISDESCNNIIEGLNSILKDINSGVLKIQDEEDIHSFVELELINRIGDDGKKLHTARSRNDQVALDLRLYLSSQAHADLQLLKDLIEALCDKAKKYSDCIMPGYTHLQRAQPINFGHQLLAYAYMFLRDYDKISDCIKRIEVSPIGACALAGTSYNTDRESEAEELGFDQVAQNSIDAVSDRDFCIEYLSVASTIMMHLSRLSEEIILWNSWEFKFINISDDFTTGSSIMPNKKNPDMAELIRGKTGRVYGNLMSLLTTLKGLPLAYNKDMQEDKEPVFDTCKTISDCLNIMKMMIQSISANKENMKLAAQKGFINATDLADYLVSKSISFRDAYKISGEVVAYCQKNNKCLEDLSLDEFKKFNKDIDVQVYEWINLENCVNKRTSLGGSSPDNIDTQIKHIKENI